MTMSTKPIDLWVLVCFSSNLQQRGQAAAWHCYCKSLNREKGVPFRTWQKSWFSYSHIAQKRSALPTNVLMVQRRRGSITLAGSVGFLPNESEEPNGSAWSVLLKKSSDEVPLKGSLSLKGSPPNGSRKKKKKGQDSKKRISKDGTYFNHLQPLKRNNQSYLWFIFSTTWISKTGLYNKHVHIVKPAQFL